MQEVGLFLRSPNTISLGFVIVTHQESAIIPSNERSAIIFEIDP